MTYSNQTYAIGQRVLMFGEYKGVITFFDTYLGYYHAKCDYCDQEHILFDQDIQPIESEETNNAVRD